MLRLAHLLSAGALLALSLAPTALADPPIHPSFPYGSSKVRGVNLGGWLVLEPWITPSLFERTGDPGIIDEFTFGGRQNINTARSALRRHWDTWITEDDFAQIAAAGLNHVRLPIGFWAFETGPGEPYISGQIPYLQRAIGWARNHGLKVVVDLHGAPGSQNGFDNSGQKLDTPRWYTNATNVARTRNILRKLTDLLKNDADVVSAIAALNEPAGFVGPDMLSVVRQYWNDAYGTIRYPYGSDRQSDIVVVLHDAFQPLSYWNDFQADANHQGVAMDTHIYQMFGFDTVGRTNEQRIASACSHASDLASFHLWAIVGEWTPAPTDCAKYLNGRGIGARYDGSYPGSTRYGSCQGLTGSRSTFSKDYKTFLRQFWEAQTSTYEKGAGWIQWTWKAEQADDWSYQAGLAGGWIPRNPTDRKYPGICG